MLEYGNMEVIRFAFDTADEKMTIQVKQEVIEDGIVIDHIFPQVIARNADFVPLLNRLFPPESGALTALVDEGKKVVNEQRQQMKARKQKEKDVLRQETGGNPK